MRERRSFSGGHSSSALPQKGLGGANILVEQGFPVAHSDKRLSANFDDWQLTRFYEAIEF
jgi:hypothetical protein